MLNVFEIILGLMISGLNYAIGSWFFKALAGSGGPDDGMELGQYYLPLVIFVCMGLICLALILHGILSLKNKSSHCK